MIRPHLLPAALVALLACAEPPPPPAPDATTAPAPPETRSRYRFVDDPWLDVPFVATPMAVVEQMLETTRTGPGDVVFDLGCGDGRIAVAAIERGADRAVCVDIDPERIADARERAERAGVAGRIEFVTGDLFQIDLSEATVVTLYLLPEVNLELRPKLLAELRPGARVVSHEYDMGDWAPDGRAGTAEHPVYHWTIPPPADTPARRP
jgi:SAM-dependent methyltransferase